MVDVFGGRLSCSDQMWWWCQIVGAEGSPAKNGISTCVQHCVYAVALSGEISHVPFWRLRSNKTGREKRGVCVCVCVQVLSLYLACLSPWTEQRQMKTFNCSATSCAVEVCVCTHTCCTCIYVSNSIHTYRYSHAYTQ